MYLPMNEQHDALEELLSVASAPSDDATGTTGMAPVMGGVGIRVWDWTSSILPCPGICSRPGVYRFSNLVYPRRLIETGVYSKLACIQENMVPTSNNGYTA